MLLVGPIRRDQISVFKHVTRLAKRASVFEWLKYKL